MSVIEIEKGVPLPPARWGRRASNRSKYPVAEMKETHDSFFVSVAEFPPSGFDGCRAMVYQLAREAGFQVSVRRTADGGMRVWRKA